MLALLAQTDYSGADTAAGAAGLAIFGGLFIFWIILLVIGLVFFIWWIFLMIDCTKREFPEKNTWMILLIVGLVIGLVWLVDILYYFMVVKKYGKINGASSSDSSTPPMPPAPTENK